MIAVQFRELVDALNRSGCHYLVVGGFAVIAHGYVRLTSDIDLVLDLEQPSEVRKALAVLTVLGYQPRVPVPLAAFADTAQREGWIRDKDMLAFAVFRPKGHFGTVGLLVAPGFPFAPAWRERADIDIGQGVIAPFLDLARLMTMKEQAGRPKDLEDLRNLRLVHDE